MQSDRQQVQVDLENELTKMLDPISKHAQKAEAETDTKSDNKQPEAKKEFKFRDFGMGPAEVYKPSYLNQGIIYW